MDDEYAKTNPKKVEVALLISDSTSLLGLKRDIT